MMIDSHSEPHNNHQHTKDLISKPQTTFFNNPNLSDAILQVIHNNGTTTPIYVSKLYLVRTSSFFNRLFTNGMKETNSQNIIIHLENETIENFKDVLRGAYKEPFVSPTEELMSVLNLADMYEFDCVVSRCLMLLRENLDSVKNACTILSIRDGISNEIEGLKKCAREFLMDKVKIIPKNATSEEILEIPFDILLEVLKGNLVVDSENSIFYVVMLWILKDIKERSQYIEQLLTKIDYSAMRNEFFLDVVPHAASYFSEPYKTNILMLYKKALEWKSGGRRRMLRLSPDLLKGVVERTILPYADHFTMKCIYRDMVKWELDGRYYSDVVFSNGYEFFFLLRVQKNVPGPSSNKKDYILAGYIRCTSKLLPEKYFLPICITMTVALNVPPFERKFAPVNVIFESPQKAIGCRITLPNETWDQIVSGNSPLVLNNTLTLTIGVEFLGTDEKCETLDFPYMESQ